MDQSFVTVRRHFGQPLRRPAGDVHDGLARPKVGDGHVFPGNTHPKAGAQGFGTRLFRGPTLGVGGRRVRATLGFLLFDLGEDSIAEAITEADKRAFDALDIAKVCSNTKDHAPGYGGEAGQIASRLSIHQSFSCTNGQMIRRFLMVAMIVLAGCSGRAWNTTVADTPAVRAAMLASVVPGQTTDGMFIGQWGRPTQILTEGGQTSFIYRNMKGPENTRLLQLGDSVRYVIVDFQYGIAVGARSSESVGCRATFPPRPPSYALDNPATVHPVNCRLAGPPGVLSDRYGTGRGAAGKYK